MSVEFSSPASDLTRPTRFAWPTDGLSFGADYNPEQWPEELWIEDARLMQRAGVNLVSLGIFAWAKLQPTSNTWNFEWLDRVIETLFAHGVSVNLATPTASPPAWLFAGHPEIGLVDASGTRMGHGARLGWCPNSAVFREYALRVVRAVAERYAGHPALRLWHVSNEIGNENHVCCCDDCAVAFRGWLAGRYGTVEVLNERWGTAFWGHTYTSFDEILPPRTISGTRSPAYTLDYTRFMSDSVIAHYRDERGVLRQVTPTVPVTTNFMVHRGLLAADYAKWAKEVDVVANDHYPVSADGLRRYEISFSADAVRGMAGGAPWMLMEHAPSAVNWQPRNRAKLPGETFRDSMQHIARGADAAMFFQWRQATAGSEQFHSGLVPHAGTDTRLWREVRALGEAVTRLAEVQGSVVAPASVAMLYDIESGWAAASGPQVTVDFDYSDLPLALHRAALDARLAVDVLPQDARFDDYSLVIVPNLYALGADTVARLRSFVEAGGHLLVTYFTGIVDEANRVLTGGYPALLRNLLGVDSEQFFPLLAGEEVALDSGYTATVFTELLRLSGAEATTQYTSGALAGEPASTVFVPAAGSGSVSYLSTRLEGAGLAALVAEVAGRAGIVPVAGAPDGVELSRRVSPSGSYLFVINHTAQNCNVGVWGRDLLTGLPFTPGTAVEPGRVVVVSERSGEDTAGTTPNER